MRTARPGSVTASRLMETRKLSKDVNWRLVKIIEKAK